jgi:tRNA(Arg) A34 adenosine deaminase TadA
MASHPPHPTISFRYPDWIDQTVDWSRSYQSDEERMRLAIAVSRTNIEHGGGPFGAAIFEMESGRIVSVGMDRVVSQNNCALHGEMVAFMMAQQRVGSHTLDQPDLPAHELVTSCEPCAMCLGATGLSGVRRVISGAAREDAVSIGFDEGPVFPESYQYLKERGISFERQLLRDEARAVIQVYHDRGGKAY